MIDHFWAPVGQGSLAKKRTEYALGTLFGDNESVEVLDKTVTQRVRQLPGFADINKDQRNDRRDGSAIRDEIEGLLTNYSHSEQTKNEKVKTKNVIGSFLPFAAR